MWGVSTAGHQYEGKNFASRWTHYEFFGSAFVCSGLGAKGLDLFEQDLDRAKAMGMTSWRCSIEWSRIEPVHGTIDPKGVAYYHRLLDAIHACGMTPMITLIHFSYPQWIEDDLGGWEGDKAVPEFEQYVAWVAHEFGSKIDYYLTFNEPNIFIPGAYVLGTHGPGARGTKAALKVVHHWIDAHKRAYRVIHAIDPIAFVSYNSYAENYEWGSYSPRFGLYSADCRNRDFTRAPTPAVEVYGTIATKGLTPDLERRFPDPRYNR